MEEALKEALKIMRGKVGENPSVFMPKMSETLSELGMLYLDENRPRDAEKAFREIFGIQRHIWKRTQQVKSDDLAQVCVVLAQTIFQQRGINIEICDLMKEAEEKAASEDIKKQAREFLEKHGKPIEK